MEFVLLRLTEFTDLIPVLLNFLYQADETVPC